jgi:nucleoside-diphosphate-sugar epimerase
MSEASRKKVVVFGASGRLGQLISRDLLTRGARVVAVMRDQTKAEAVALRAAGADIAALDISSAAATRLADVLSGAYAVVSALQGGPDVLVEAQRQLLVTAREQGVRRFLPSDFSFNFFTLPAGANINSDWRRTFADVASRDRGNVEVVHLMQGMFTDATVAGFVGLYDRASNVVSYWGNGDTPIDWTTWEDTARFAAAAALDERAVPQELFVAGDRRSAKELQVSIGAVRAAPALREMGSLEELDRQIEARRKAEPENMYAWLPLMYARGLFGGKALLGGLENARYPEIQPESLRAAIERGAL